MNGGMNSGKYDVMNCGEYCGMHCVKNSGSIGRIKKRAQYRDQRRGR
jgi:hypothetical protein